MIGGRPAPRWGAAAISYLVASLAGGVLLSAIENLPDMISGTAGAAGIANATIGCLVYGAVGGLNLVLPVALVGLAFWWLGVHSLAAYVGAAGVIAGALVASGLSVNDIELIPAALLGGLVFWACMRVSRPAVS